MKRTRVAILLSAVIVAFVAVVVDSAKGGCHGGCLAHSGRTRVACDGKIHPVGTPAINIATTGSDPATDLELYSIHLASNSRLDSTIRSGEATVFYVVSGSITFTFNTEVAAGSARVVADLDSGPVAASHSEMIQAGGALFLDAQSQDVIVFYGNEGTSEATLMITSAVPCQIATPSAASG